MNSVVEERNGLERKGSERRGEVVSSLVEYKWIWGEGG